MGSKLCRDCGVTKGLGEFHSHKGRSDGLNTYCKACQSARCKAWRSNNLEDARAASRRSYIKNVEAAKERARRYYHNNKSSCTSARKSYAAKNKERLNAAKRNREARLFAEDPEGFREKNRTKTARKRASNPISRLANLARNRIGACIRQKGFMKAGHTMQAIGCDWAFLKSHLEQKFSKGMTWDNYGYWHVDHIIPLSSAQSEEELMRLCHYTNLQPLWAADNIRKGASISEAA